MTHKRRSHTWTDTHDIEEREIEVGGKAWQIRGTLKITWDYDPNADCDADGNRGREMTSEDERRWTPLGAAPIDAEGECGPELAGDAIPEAVRAAAETWADNCELDQEPYEPEPDDDRGD